MPCVIVQPPAATAFTPSGMYKNGSTQSAGSSSSQITGWVADTAAFPGSTVSSDGLVVQAASDDATVTANIAFSGTFSGTWTVRLYLNGAQIAQGPGVNASSGTATAEATGVTVAPGDVVTVRISTTSSFGSQVSAGSGTWVHVVAAA